MSSAPAASRSLFDQPDALLDKHPDKHLDERDDDRPADQVAESRGDLLDDQALDYYRPPETAALGLVRLRASDKGLTEIVFVGEAEADETPRPNALTDRAHAQLEEYFDGLRQTFDLPLAPKGTDFQQRVWQALSTIPFGETRCYAEIAEQLNRRGGQRAVGRANGQNPLAIVVPCHRVIGSDGRLTGYAGGIGRKQWLLAHEAGEIPFDLG
ncbi:methylated-DNA--[protein]-cysteine S-methyltransferase [Halomonas sp. I5-271120]|uniref:methylated-DNA--[protein]-cysteine S-methyltransferase n=1 Tax=Halomonas sp. I5-271120 TaxID=3061632 RepID=UPI002714D7C5|nr:methylated-DNA--[protein]-cysteine S-methyltransferase [Halomonas sp. I5-271120]